MAGLEICRIAECVCVYVLYLNACMSACMCQTRGTLLLVRMSACIYIYIFFFIDFFIQVYKSNNVWSPFAHLLLS